jgi:hypothetical protein
MATTQGSAVVGVFESRAEAEQAVAAGGADVRDEGRR